MNRDTLWINATLAMPGGQCVPDGAVLVRGDTIVFAGPAAQLPPEVRASEPITRDCQAALVTPGLIDAHTHLVYAGSRAGEFEQRLTGVSYEDIARQGGGIRATVAATRAADEDALVAQSVPRLHALMREGVTTVEIKSGYGLSTAVEARMLRAAPSGARRQRGDHLPGGARAGPGVCRRSGRLH